MIAGHQIRGDNDVFCKRDLGLQEPFDGRSYDQSLRFEPVLMDYSGAS